MAIVNTAGAVKTLVKAVPTINTSENVVSWKLVLEYSLNDYKSNFVEHVEIENPSKKAADYSKDELIALMDTENIDLAFESRYTNVKVAPQLANSVVNNFNLDDLK